MMLARGAERRGLLVSMIPRRADKRGLFNDVGVRRIDEVLEWLLPIFNAGSIGCRWESVVLNLSLPHTTQLVQTQ